MSRRIVFAVIFSLAAASAYADFDALVSVVGSTRGMHRIWTPGISLIRLGVRFVHPAGVHDFQIAVFEGEGNIDLKRVMRGTPETPMVRTHDNRTGETAVIWARPLRSDLIEMLLVAHDPNDQTVVLRAVIDGEMLAREISDPRHASSVRAGFSRP
jgi:hypothetical protein